MTVSTSGLQSDLWAHNSASEYIVHKTVPQNLPESNHEDRRSAERQISNTKIEC